MLCLSVSASAIDFDRLDWQPSLQKDNLSIEVAQVEGFAVKAFKARSIYDASLQQMVGVITDMDNFTQWVEGALVADVVGNPDANSQAVYYVNHVPWPLKNRDGVIVQSVRRVDSHTVRIDLSTDKNAVPLNSEYVRINELEGAWILREVADNKVELTYQMHLDPTGILPASVVNMLLTDTPRKTLQNLHKQDLGRYSGVALGMTVAE